MNYFLLLILFFVILIFYIQIARLLDIVDHPNSRSSHNNTTIRGGGIIFPIGALIWFFLSKFQFPLFFTGLSIISIISFWDDIKQLSSKTRLVFQFVAILLLFFELGFQHLSWLNWILALIITLGIINAFNFMDGINGITGGYSLSVLIGLIIVNTYQEKFIDEGFLFIVSVAILVFCFFNFRKKAVCFAGDVGSISIAFIIIFLLAKLIIQTNNLIYLFFLSVYGIDSILTIIYRLWKMENIFEAHRKHLYQLLANELKIPHLMVASIYAFVQLIISVLIVILIKTNESITSWVVGLITVFILLSIFIFLRFKINTIHTKL